MTRLFCHCTAQRLAGSKKSRLTAACIVEITRVRAAFTLSSVSRIAARLLLDRRFLPEDKMQQGHAAMPDKIRDQQKGGPIMQRAQSCGPTPTLAPEPEPDKSGKSRQQQSAQTEALNGRGQPLGPGARPSGRANLRADPDESAPCRPRGREKSISDRAGAGCMRPVRRSKHRRPCPQAYDTRQSRKRPRASRA